MRPINPASADTAVPFSNPTPHMWVLPVLYAAILHRQPMKISQLQRVLFFVLFNPETSHPLETRKMKTKWESEG